MLQSAREPMIRPHPGTRPMALLVLAIGVAIGGSLPGTPVRAIDPPAPATVRPGDSGDRKAVRMIPLPVRDAPAMSGG